MDKLRQNEKLAFEIRNRYKNKNKERSELNTSSGSSILFNSSFIHLDLLLFIYLGLFLFLGIADVGQIILRFSMCLLFRKEVCLGMGMLLFFLLLLCFVTAIKEQLLSLGLIINLSNLSFPIIDYLIYLQLFDFNHNSPFPKTLIFVLIYIFPFFFGLIFNINITQAPKSSFGTILHNFDALPRKDHQTFLCSTIVSTLIIFFQQVRKMMEVKKLFTYLFSLLTHVIGFIPATIYSFVYSEFFTKYTYRLIGERNKNNMKIKNILDIGTATGGPLKTIVHLFDHARILGIDYNPLYIPACQKLFKQHENVEIRYMNYYDIEREEPETMYDIIIFGSSFMILPDQTKALEIAQRKLNKGGKIYFLLTLYDEKTFTNKILEFVKPMLKYLCTVDFGKVTYKAEFEDFLIGHELKINFSQRLYGNIFLKMAKFYMYEAVK